MLPQMLVILASMLLLANQAACQASSSSSTGSFGSTASSLASFNTSANATLPAPATTPLLCNASTNATFIDGVFFNSTGSYINGTYINGTFFNGTLTAACNSSIPLPAILPLPGLLPVNATFNTTTNSTFNATSNGTASLLSTRSFHLQHQLPPSLLHQRNDRAINDHTADDANTPLHDAHTNNIQAANEPRHTNALHKLQSIIRKLHN